MGSFMMLASNGSKETDIEECSPGKERTGYVCIIALFVRFKPFQRMKIVMRRRTFDV